MYIPLNCPPVTEGDDISLKRCRKSQTILDTICAKP